MPLLALYLLSMSSHQPHPLELLPRLLCLSTFSSPPSPLGLLLSAFYVTSSPLHSLLQGFSSTPSPTSHLPFTFSSPPSRLGLLLSTPSSWPLLSASSLGLFSRPSLSASSLSLSFRPILSARPLGFTEPCVSPGFLRHLSFGIREPTQKIESERSESRIVSRQPRSGVLRDDLWGSWIRLPF